MTVTYTAEVATCRGFGCFLKLLFRWKGSIYKLVWPDLILFLGTFFSLKVMYLFFLDEEQQKVFAKISAHCREYGNLIPISFILGFYVSIVVGRWWDQFIAIPKPDSIAVFVSANIHGQDEKGRVIRRTIMRYVCLSMTMCFTMISPRVKKRFPTLDHLVDAGLMLDNEKEIIDNINRNCPSYSKGWIPIVWASSIVTRARKEGKIRDDFAVKTILDELNKFRAQCGLLNNYDWISVPLVYTQVCTLAVYSYFAAAVMGSQWLKQHADEKHKEGESIDLFFPIFPTLQFFFYMGWLKVAESLINPFGDDDDDFELNWLVDRNLQVSYLIVDEMHHDHPELIKDQYWNDVFIPELPYTVASEHYREEPPSHSTANIMVTEDEGEIVSPPSVRLDEMPDYADVGRRVSRVSLSPSKRSSFARRERNSSFRSNNLNASQSTLAESVSGKLSRAGSITSVFKRMFSRDRDRDRDLNSPSDGRLPEFVIGSTANVHRKVHEEAIPELDENMTTIMSMRAQEKHPTVYDIFGAKPTPKEGAGVGIGGIDIPTMGTTTYAGPVAGGGGGGGLAVPAPLAGGPQLSTSAPAAGFTRPKFLNFSVSVPAPSSSNPLQTPDIQVAPPSMPKASSLVFDSKFVDRANAESFPKTRQPKPTHGHGSNPPPLRISTASEDTEDEYDHEDQDQDLDDTMDDLNVRRRSAGGSISQRIAKTLGFKKDKEGGSSVAEGDERAEVHLLSDVSRDSTDTDKNNSSVQ